MKSKSKTELNLSDVTATLETNTGAASYVKLAKLGEACGAEVAQLPHTVKTLRRISPAGSAAGMCRRPVVNTSFTAASMQMVLRQILAT